MGGEHQHKACSHYNATGRALAEPTILNMFIRTYAQGHRHADGVLPRGNRCEVVVAPCLVSFDALKFFSRTLSQSHLGIMFLSQPTVGIAVGPNTHASWHQSRPLHATAPDVFSAKD